MTDKMSLSATKIEYFMYPFSLVAKTEDKMLCPRSLGHLSFILFY